MKDLAEMLADAKAQGIKEGRARANKKYNKIIEIVMDENIARSFEHEKIMEVINED